MLGHAFKLFSTSAVLRIHCGTQSLNCFLSTLIARAKYNCTTVYLEWSRLNRRPAVETNLFVSWTNSESRGHSYAWTTHQLNICALLEASSQMLDHCIVIYSIRPFVSQRRVYAIAICQELYSTSQQSLYVITLL